MTGTVFLDGIMLAGAVGVGLIFGSFINVVIHRGPTLWGLVDGEARGDLFSPGSYCPSCKTPIGASRLIPIFSYVMLRGRCASCGAAVSPRYPIVEALGAGAALAAVLAFGMSWNALAAAAFGLALIALAFIDLDTGYLPDAITLPLIAGGLIANAFGLFVPFQDAAIGAAVGHVAFRAIGLAYEKWRGREGLGQGDAKLLAAIGAWCGWMLLPIAVFIGAAGTLIATLAVKGRTSETPVPFGPGLCAAAFAALVFARDVIAAY